MRILLLTETFFPTNEPTAKIVQKIVNYCSDCDFYIISKGECQNIVGDNFYNIQIPSFYNKPRNIVGIVRWFVYKVLIKFYSMFFPKDLFDTSRFVKKALQITKINKFDLIIAVSGWFSAQKAASIINKKTKIPFCSIYCDPFLHKIGYENFSLNKLKKIETEWLFPSTMIFLPSNYLKYYVSEYGMFSKKISSFELPCLIDKKDYPIVSNHSFEQKGLISYFGYFFGRVKIEQWLLDLFKRLKNMRVRIYDFVSPKSNIQLPDNVEVTKRVFGNDYLEEVAKSDAILVVDNDHGIQIPSKLIEAISSNKKIIFVYFNCDSPGYRLAHSIKEGIFLLKYDSNSFDSCIERIRDFMLLENSFSRKIYTNESQLLKISEFLRKCKYE